MKIIKKDFVGLLLIIVAAQIFYQIVTNSFSLVSLFTTVWDVSFTLLFVYVLLKYRTLPNMEDNIVKSMSERFPFFQK